MDVTECCIVGVVWCGVVWCRVVWCGLRLQVRYSAMSLFRELLLKRDLKSLFLVDVSAVAATGGGRSAGKAQCTLMPDTHTHATHMSFGVISTIFGKYNEGGFVRHSNDMPFDAKIFPRCVY